MLPKSDVQADIAIWKGQYIPERDLTCFLKDTGSGWIGDGDSTSEKKQPNQRESPMSLWRKNNLHPISGIYKYEKEAGIPPKYKYLGLLPEVR